MNLPELKPLSDQPLISVLIVNYNYARFLPTAIESALGQTYQRFELVICDDGSSDDSRAVISSYAEREPRIKTIFKANAGVAAALNDSFRASSGEIITMLDADDIFEKTKLERLAEKLVSGGRVGMVLNRLKKVDSQGNEIGSIPQFGSFDRGELRERLLNSAAHWSVAPTSGISFRRECAERVFPIPENQFRTEADGYMCTIAPLFYAVDVIDEALTIYRVHSSNLTASSSIDVRFCERIMSAGERVFSVLQKTAAEHGWRVTQLDDNPTYCEMRLIRDYLQGASFAVNRRNLHALKSAAARVQTADASKTKTKAALLGLAVMLPSALGTTIINNIYLPNSTKRLATRFTRRFR